MSSLHLISGHRFEPREILEDLGGGPACGLRQVNPRLNIFLLLIVVWHAFIPYDACVVDIAQYVQEVLLDMFPILHRHAPLVPAVKHEVINSLIESALGRQHEVDLVDQTHRWQDVVDHVSERFLLQDVLELIYF